MTKGPNLEENNLMSTRPGEGEVDVGLYRITVYPSIGGGAFGQVCKAVHRDTQQRVAAKGIRYSWDDDNDEVINIAIDEAENMKLIRHEHIVPLIDYQSHKGTVWIFMELCELGDLERYLRHNSDISFPNKCELMVQIASAVLYLHSHNPIIIHRDIKPQNILMKRKDGQDVALLSDFGFAKLYDRSYTLTGSKFYFAAHESRKGTPHYMAPEFFLVESSRDMYTTAVDIFSLGLLYSGLLECRPGNASTLPLSVEARHQNRSTAYGYELSQCYKACEPFPHIVEFLGTEHISVLEVKQLILQMTAFDHKKRIGIDQVMRVINEINDGIQELENADPNSPSMRRQRSSSSLSSASSVCSFDNFPIEGEGNLKQKKKVRLSLFPLGLKPIGGELWSCQADGIAVYNRELHHLRTLRISNLGFMYSAALLRDCKGRVVVAALDGLRIVEKDGTNVKQVAEGLHWDVAVQGVYCFACPARLPVIDVYKYNANWERVRTINLPCREMRCASLAHTLAVRDNTIHVCCSGKNLIFMLDISGSHDSLVRHSYGPEVKYTMQNATIQNSGASSKIPTTNLIRPHICHQNDDGSVVIANTVRHRLLVMDGNGNFTKLKLSRVKRPIGAVWFKERLYVSSWGDRCITKFAYV